MDKVTFQEGEVTWWLTSDHGERFATHLKGMRCTAVKGGRVEHIRAILEDNNYGVGQITAFVIIIGGNDLEQNRPPKRVAQDIRNLVEDTMIKNRACTVITGDIIPRRGVEKPPVSPSAAVALAANMRQSPGNDDHHHFEDNIFIREYRDNKG